MVKIEHFELIVFNKFYLIEFKQYMQFDIQLSLL